jgi:hypothetical protein
MKRVLVLVLAAAGVGGCMERRIHVTSQPPGATVWLNDVEVGRTPLTTGFRYYGTYDVRVRKDGYEPVWTGKTAWTPLWEVPPVDLVATALPMRIQNQVDWHFDLVPTPVEEAGPLLERGREMKARVDQ